MLPEDTGLILGRATTVKDLTLSTTLATPLRSGRTASPSGRQKQKSLSKYAVKRKSSILATVSPRQSRAPPPNGMRARGEPPPPSRKRSGTDREGLKKTNKKRLHPETTKENRTWFEAVRVCPNGRIVVSSKQIGDDDRVSGDEVTCNTEHWSPISVSS